MIIAKSNVYLQQNLVNSTCAGSRKRMKKFLEEQHGEARAEYGKGIINNLSKRLIVEYGGNKSFTPRDLRNYRQFYLIFKDFEIWYARVPNLNWTHYRSLIRVQNTMGDTGKTCVPSLVPPSLCQKFLGEVQRYCPACRPYGTRKHRDNTYLSAKK